MTQHDWKIYAEVHVHLVNVLMKVELCEGKEIDYNHITKYPSMIGNAPKPYLTPTIQANCTRNPRQLL